MNKKSVTVVLLLLIFTVFWAGDARCDEYYRTFEIIGKSENSLTLQDNDGNVIEVDEDPAGYKVGYKVRYDSVRNRLRDYRWQEYEVIAVSDNSITMRHRTGDILSVAGNYANEFEVGDEVRYDSVGDKLRHDEDAGQWQQYTVVNAGRNEITLESTTGEQITLGLDNNIYEVPRNLFIPKYKVGDHVRYNASTGQLRKGIIRTYDWRDYQVKEVTEERITLINAEKEELVLENTFNNDFRTGDRVKYDRLNNLLKKAR